MLRKCFAHLNTIERKRIVMPAVVGMRLNRGERPEPWPVAVQAAVSNALARRLSTFQQYPSYQEFYEKLSNYIGIPTSQIVVGAGIEEFIRTLMFLCCDPGQKAAVLWPTCAMYDIYAQAFGVDLIRVKPEPGKPFGMTDFMEAIPGDTRVVFVPNPGQPVETCFNIVQLTLLADMCQYSGMVLAIDEAHFGFGAPTALPLVKKYNNVVVMRTFSKFYGAASIRVGYAVGQPRIIKSLHAVRPSGEIAGPSLIIASTLLEHHETFVAYAKEVAEARDWLREQIINLGFMAWGKAGFSLLVEFPTSEDALGVADTLAQRGVLVKSGFPEPVEKCILFSCGSMLLAKRFFSVFEQLAVIHV
jgi:histidinol-phosphate aminotransferase